MTIGEKIRKYRLAHKWTQEELSVKVDLTPKFIQLLENNRRNPSLKTLRKLARVLGIKVKDLV